MLFDLTPLQPDQLCVADTKRKEAQKFLCLLYKVVHKCKCSYFDGQHHYPTSPFREERLPFYLRFKNFENHPITRDTNMVKSSERNRKKLLFVVGFSGWHIEFVGFFPQHHNSVCISQCG